MTSHIYAEVKRRATELGARFAKFVRRVSKRELDAAVPHGDIDSICGMVTGTPFDMAREGKQLIAEATSADALAF